MLVSVSVMSAAGIVKGMTPLREAPAGVAKVCVPSVEPSCFLRVKTVEPSPPVLMKVKVHWRAAPDSCGLLGPVMARFPTTG